MNIGLNFEEREKLAHGISTILADTYTLYLKTQNFHWNVQGPRFFELHGMFEEHYKALAESIDDIAERIRTLGHRAPGSLTEFSALKTIPEFPRELKAETMIEHLVEDHEAIALKIKELTMMAKSLVMMVLTNSWSREYKNTKRPLGC